MYLHEQLLEIAKQAKIDLNDDEQALCDIKNLNEKIIGACEDYYTSRIKIGMLKKDAKNVIDKTFNLFDLFVNIAVKSDDISLNAIGEMYKKHSFKKWFLSDKNTLELYNSL